MGKGQEAAEGQDGAERGGRLRERRSGSRPIRVCGDGAGGGVGGREGDDAEEEEGEWGTRGVSGAAPSPLPPPHPCRHWPRRCLRNAHARGRATDARGTAPAAAMRPAAVMGPSPSCPPPPPASCHCHWHAKGRRGAVIAACRGAGKRSSAGPRLRPPPPPQPRPPPHYPSAPLAAAARTAWSRIGPAACPSVLPLLCTALASYALAPFTAAPSPHPALVPAPGKPRS